VVGVIKKSLGGITRKNKTRQKGAQGGGFLQVCSVATKLVLWGARNRKSRPALSSSRVGREGGGREGSGGGREGGIF